MAGSQYSDSPSEATASHAHRIAASSPPRASRAATCVGRSRGRGRAVEDMGHHGCRRVTSAAGT
eukprot:457765-Prymnesium_polylepis.1